MFLKALYAWIEVWAGNIIFDQSLSLHLCCIQSPEVEDY